MKSRHKASTPTLAGLAVAAAVGLLVFGALLMMAPQIAHWASGDTPVSTPPQTTGFGGKASDSVPPAKPAVR